MTHEEEKLSREQLHRILDIVIDTNGFEARTRSKTGTLPAIKRCIQHGMKQNGYKILQRNIILSDWTTRNGEYTYISFYDRTDLQRYRMWFSKDNYTDEHKSFWEIQKAGSMTFADLLNPII